MLFFVASQGVLQPTWLLVIRDNGSLENQSFYTKVSVCTVFLHPTRLDLSTHYYAVTSIESLHAHITMHLHTRILKRRKQNNRCTTSVGIAQRTPKTLKMDNRSQACMVEKKPTFGPRSQHISVSITCNSYQMHLPTFKHRSSLQPRLHMWIIWLRSMY
jgi:hypothetical protein